MATGADGEGELTEVRTGGTKLASEVLARNFGNPIAHENWLCRELGNDGVRVLIPKCGRDRMVGQYVEMKFSALAKDLAEVFPHI